MYKYKSIFFAVLLIFSVIFAMQEIAEAKRFGGGRSFGGRANTSRSFSQNRTAPTQNQTMNQNRGLFGGMGGLFGGLLAGTLIGSLLGGGGFGGIGFMDIIIFGVLAFILFKLFRRTSSSQSRSYQYSAPQNGANPTQNTSMWGALGANREEEYEEGAASPYPQDFDAQDFLKGAKILFVRMQESWGKRDIQDIGTFTSARIFMEIQQQAQEDPTPEPVKVLDIQAEITDVHDAQNERIVDVLFTATLQESPNTPISTVTEAWHFIRSQETQSKWVLDGITQVE